MESADVEGERPEQGFQDGGEAGRVDALDRSDPAERAALEALLAGGGAQLSCVDADTTSPAVAISSDASAPVTGPFSIAIAFSEPVTGFELEDLVVGSCRGTTRPTP